MSSAYTLAEVNGKWTLFSNGTPFLVFDNEAEARRAEEDLETFIEAGERPEHSIKDLFPPQREHGAARPK